MKNAEIATMIEIHAQSLPETAADTTEQTALTVGNFTVRFLATKPAALAVAAKFRKGKTPARSYTPPKMPSTKPAPFSQATLDQFLADLEYDNAREYAALHAREVYFCANGAPLMKPEKIKADPRFMVGKMAHPNGHEWAVVHEESGQWATIAPEKGIALAKFKELDPGKLEAAVEAAVSN